MTSFDSIFMEPAPSGPFTVLTVCTGNICRSPLSETLLRMVLAGLPVTVHSAGTHALVGEPMQAPNQAIATDLGVADGAEHRARQITVEHLREADLVLALSREHRREVVELLPRASRQVFTLREFARLASEISPDDLAALAGDDETTRLRNVVELVAQLRGTLPPLDDPADADVVDPYRQSSDVYRQQAEQLIPAVNATAALLRNAAQLGV